MVGYGPEPCACLDLAQGFAMTILGNHDQGALFDPECFSSVAERAIFWTRQQLENKGGSRADRARRWEFLAERPRTYCDSHGLFVHGSARNPLNEYVFPEDTYNHPKMERLFNLVESYCFQGHTHVPGIFMEQAPGSLRFPHTGGDRSRASARRPQDAVQRRLRRSAARRRLAGLLHPARRRHHPLSPRRVRRGSHRA